MIFWKFSETKFYQNTTYTPKHIILQDFPSRSTPMSTMANYIKQNLFKIHYKTQ